MAQAYTCQYCGTHVKSGNVHLCAKAEAAGVFGQGQVQQGQQNVMSQMAWIPTINSNAAVPQGQIWSVQEMSSQDADIQALKGAVEQLVIEVRSLYQENQALKKRVEELEGNLEEVNWQLEAGWAPTQEEQNKPPTHVPECKDCMAWPCDCNEKIWTYRIKQKDSVEQWNTSKQEYCYSRPEVADQLVRYAGAHKKWGWKIGPPQRITDPPYQFPEE